MPPKPDSMRILGHSATSVLKWMGAKGFTREQADKVMAKLGKGPEILSNTITTALADGRNPKYRKGLAELTADQIKKIKAAAGK